MDTKIDEKYLPHIEDRKTFLDEQINQSKHIIWRNIVEMTEAKAAGKEAELASSEFNLKQLTRKIDIYEEELKKLG